MSRPGTHIRARNEAVMLLLHSLPGKFSNCKRRGEMAGRIAEAIWKRWKVGIWQWRLKHLQWYLDMYLEAAAPSTRYKYWNAVRAVLLALGRPHLVDCLAKRRNAGYLRPTGQPGPLGAGRRLKVARALGFSNSKRGP